MSERLERVSFYIAAIIQIIAVVWWASALDTAVDRQDKVTDVLTDKVSTLNDRVIRIEEKTTALEGRVGRLVQESDRSRDVLLRLEKKLNDNI